MDGNPEYAPVEGIRSDPPNLVCIRILGIYQMALDKTGCAANEVVFVGDSPEQDIAGARILGMTTVLIRDGDAPPPGAGGLEASSPHFIIDELNELTEILDGAG